MLDSVTNLIKRLQEISEANQDNVIEEKSSKQEEINPIEAYRNALSKSKSSCNTFKSYKQDFEDSTKKAAAIISALNPDVRNIMTQQAIIALVKDILNNNYSIKKCMRNDKVVTTIILGDIPILEYTDTEGKLLSLNIDLIPKDYELVEVAVEKMKYVNRKINKALDVRNLKD